MHQQQKHDGACPRRLQGTQIQTLQRVFERTRKCSSCTSETTDRLARLDAHVAMPIKGLDAREELVVVPHVDEDLCVVLDALPSKSVGPRGASRGKEGTRGSRRETEALFFARTFDNDMISHRIAEEKKAMLFLPTFKDTCVICILSLSFKKAGPSCHISAPRKRRSKSIPRLVVDYTARTVHREATCYNK